ncbi:hypothetical protein C8A03DRAFT_34730 [Achaetomium macrosporum]|uniref:BTB domain-containing protein n=1 Tax=Achaetomium macrosporum TaxID=79813 RepID=A0AAN7HA37_9PEZI|nr:hypothetical protein C8A03DRAFT_34730 [Achaetomium macrosporum]
MSETRSEGSADDAASVSSSPRAPSLNVANPTTMPNDMLTQINDLLPADEAGRCSAVMAISDTGVGEVSLGSPDDQPVMSPSGSDGKSKFVETSEAVKKTHPGTEHRVDERATRSPIKTGSITDVGGVLDSPVSPDDKCATSPSGIVKKSGSVENSESTTEGTQPETNHRVDQPGQHASSVVSYHEDADMFIRISELEGVKVVYKACSALVAAASPTLKSLIDSKKHSLPADGELVLDVADFGNDSYGLGIVLSIIHYKFHEIPTRPDVDQLYGIARVVERCDCAHLLVPYMEKWVAGLNWHIVMKDEQNDDEKTLYLAWAFGEARYFARMLPKVAHRATLSDTGVLVDTHGRPWHDQGLPLAVVELIAKTRYDCLAKVMNSIDKPLRALMGGGQAAMKFCRSRDADQQQLGSLMSALAAAGLFPFPAVEKCHISVVEAVKDLEEIKVGRFKMPHTLPHLDSHIGCGIRHKEVIKSAMNEDIPLTHWISQQLIARARKSGAFSEEVFKEIKGMQEAIVIPDSTIKDLGAGDRRSKQVMAVDDSVPDLKLGSPESEVDK